jgi:hypothetical protein
MVVGPCKRKPVLFDDTCYFLPFADEAEARVVADVLNSKACRALLEALMFEDAKRPVTVELLRRLNLSAIADEAGMSARWRAIQRTGYSRHTAAPQLELIMERAESVSPKRLKPAGAERAPSSTVRKRRPARPGSVISED